MQPMSTCYDIAALKSRIGAIKFEDNPALVRQKSRDFYWYSPTLKRQLDTVTADIVVSPRSEAEVLQVLRAAFELGIPVTPRGTGTGNYGQAMPLSGGIVLDLSGFNAVKTIAPGRVVAEPGAVIAAIDKETRPRSGQEIRLHPSTYNTASIGGFIAGGSGGVGSIRWGGLRDPGNIIRLRVATMEATPRVLDLSGDELHKVSHAYGTNGIITEVEMPARARLRVGRHDCRLRDLARCLVLRQCGGRAGRFVDQAARRCRGAGAAPYFLRHQKYLPRDKHVALVTVASQCGRSLLAFTSGSREPIPCSGRTGCLTPNSKGCRRSSRLSWNHTTLRGPAGRSGHYPICSLSIPFRTRSILSTEFMRASVTRCWRIWNSCGSTARSRASGCLWCASRPRSGSTKSRRFTRTWARRSSILTATPWRKAG
jgi:hypothetical protein